jgi:dTDP-4-amino-4,6-dideoxy-D-galactose acyltransferase
LKNSITILDWDSDFFAKKICRVNRKIKDEEELSEVSRLLIEQAIDLAYYSSTTPLDEKLMIADAYLVKLVDKKTTYIKAIQKNALYDSSVLPYWAEFPEQSLLDLAVESGMHSRFRVDEKIGVKKFQELYRTWIINSVNKKIAKEVLVYKSEKTIAGFVTLGEKNAVADIGIIAVDERFRGRGVGKALMRSAENWFANNTNFQQIQVVTQGANVAACRLYEACGYHVGSVEYFYHLWRKP